MLRARYILRLVSAFLSRFKLLILLSIGFGIIMFLLVNVFVPVIFQSKAERIGLTGRYTTSTLPQTILNKIGSGLTKLDESGNVEPDIATSWESTDGGKTWIFKLREDVYWQDGKKLTSTAISYQFSDVEVERPDQNTIVFRLQDAYSAFPAVVSRPIFKSGLLGTGEWDVKRLSLAGSFINELTLENNRRSRIIYKFYPSEERTVLAFQLGQVDTIIKILQPDPLINWPKISYDEQTETGEYVALFFNNQDSLLSDKNIRQALAYGIDKEALGGIRAISPVSVSSWAYNPQVKPYTFDATKAKGIIDDYKEQSGTSEIQINLTTTPVLIPQAEKIKKNWEELGISVNLQSVSTIPNDYQALLAIFDEPASPDQYSVWHSTQTQTNITHYQNPRIDKLLEDGRSEMDLTERKKIYLDFQRFLVEDSPAVFLYYPTTYTFSR